MGIMGEIKTPMGHVRAQAGSQTPPDTLAALPALLVWTSVR